jgi:hypothetical protein
MPRIALLVLGVLGGCSFEADYAAGVYRCADRESKCPEGLVCDPNLDGVLVCREPRMDAAAADSSGDGMGIDAPSYLLNCDKPYELPPTGGSFSASTELRNNKLQPTCFNRTMVGQDAVHVITPGAGKTMFVKVEAATFAATAYVVSACSQTACNGNNYATPTKTISVYTLAGPHYVVVDSGDGTAFGPYTLTVSFQ